MLRQKEERKSNQTLADVCGFVVRDSTNVFSVVKIHTNTIASNKKKRLKVDNDMYYACLNNRLGAKEEREREGEGKTVLVRYISPSTSLRTRSYGGKKANQCK